jgi:hypothetical protein
MVQPKGLLAGGGVARVALALCGLLCLVLCVGALCACGAQAPTGVRGTVIVSPAIGPSQPPAPNALVTVARASDGKVVARVHTDEKGTFVVHLAPGRYSVKASWSGTVTRMETVTVKNGHLTRTSLIFVEM